MSGGNALAVALSISAGLTGSIQAAALGKLEDRIGSFQAVAFSTAVAASLGAVVLLVVRQSVHAYAEGVRQPAWLWLGGILSTFIILALTVATPKIGVTATVALVISGNLAMAAVVDRYGWLGVEKVALGWPRILGLLLLAAGAALTLRR